MFNRYWREYPWWLQVFQFTLMIFIFTYFATAVLALLVPLVTGVALADMANVTDNMPPSQISALLLSQAIFHILAYFTPPILYANIAHPRPKWYLGLRKPRRAVHWVLAPLVVLGALPVFIALTSWMSQFDFGPAMAETQEQTERLTMAMLAMPTFTDFLITFFILAILPGFSEELLFRGIIMRFGAQKIKKIVYPIVISALLFTWAHSNIYGLPAILLAGILLGYIYYLTGSLWCSILAHTVHNGFQVVLSYLAKDSLMLTAAINENELPWYLPLAGLAVFVVAITLLYKNRTPLPDDWADDFAGEKRNTTNNFTA